MNIPIGDLIDRYTVLVLKLEHGLKVRQELDKYLDEIPPQLSKETIKELYGLNKKIWDLETKIGKLALEVRELNDLRSKKKNEIAILYNEFLDQKVFYVTNRSNVKP